MIYTYFTQTRTGAIFWHFYQSRIPLGWNEQSIRNMDIFAIGGSKERGYVIYDVEFDDIYIWNFVLFIDDDQLVELEDISIEVWKSWKI